MFNLNHSAHLGNAELAQQAAEKSIRCVARTGDIVLGVIAVGNSKQQAFRPKGRMLCREQRQSKSLILDEVFSAGKECKHKNQCGTHGSKPVRCGGGKACRSFRIQKTVLPTVNTAAAISPITAGFKPDISPATILLLLNFL